MEIPSLTCPTWSHFIQDKVENSIYLCLDRYKGSQYNFVFHFNKLKCCIENSVDSGSTRFNREFISSFMLRGQKYLNIALVLQDE